MRNIFELVQLLLRSVPTAQKIRQFNLFNMHCDVLCIRKLQITDFHYVLSETITIACPVSASNMLKGTNFVRPPISRNRQFILSITSTTLSDCFLSCFGKRTKSTEIISRNPPSLLGNFCRTLRHGTHLCLSCEFQLGLCFANSLCMQLKSVRVK